MLSHVDLCSGIGGFALGFQWAGLSKPVLFCDIEPWSRQILAKHWPDVPIATDVKELANDPDGLIPRTDPKRTILTAGYPCQPFSHAGKRLGQEDDRHIWPYILQIVAHKRPAWCVFENVYGHVSMGLDQVLLDLETQGYASRTFIIPACGIDAPHRRDRVFVVAHTTDADRRRREVREAGGNGEPTLHGEERDVADTNSKQNNDERQFGKQKRGAVGRVQQAAQRIDRRTGTNRVGRHSQDVADTRHAGVHQQRQPGDVEQEGGNERRVRRDGLPKRKGDERQTVADTDSQRGRSGNAGRQDAEDAGQPSRHTRNNPRGMGSWLTEPSICGMADGIPHWVDEPRDTPRVATGVKQRAARLKGLGNAIVPQIAQKIGEAIKASIDA